MAYGLSVIARKLRHWYFLQQGLHANILGNFTMYENNVATCNVGMMCCMSMQCGGCKQILKTSKIDRGWVSPVLGA